MVKKNAILAPLGVLVGLALFSGIGYALVNAGMKSMDAWVDDTAALADDIFSGKSASNTAASSTTQGTQNQTTVATPAATAPQAGQLAAASTTPPALEQPQAQEPQTQQTQPTTYVTAEGYSGTVAPDHVVHDGETWVSRVDSYGKSYYRTSVYLPIYGQDVDLADYGGSCYFVAQDGQPIYWDENKAAWVLVEEYTPWVSPF